MTPRHTAPRPRLLIAVPAATFALTLLLAGCGGSSDTGSSSSDQTPAASDSGTPSSSGTEVDVTVQGDSITPTNKQIEIGVGDTVTLHVTSDRDGELHVHSSPEQELEFTKGTTDLEITLDKPGSVDVEEHATETLLLRILVS